MKLETNPMVIDSKLVRVENHWNQYYAIVDHQHFDQKRIIEIGLICATIEENAVNYKLLLGEFILDEKEGFTEREMQLTIPIERELCWSMRSIEEGLNLYDCHLHWNDIQDLLKTNRQRHRGSIYFDVFKQTEDNQMLWLGRTISTHYILNNLTEAECNTLRFHVTLIQ
jgi:hypothetical protein